MYERFGKRAWDILLSGTAILVFFPLLCIIGLWIKLDSRGPVLFRQTRIGAKGTTFHILKFRTMTVDAPGDTPTHLLADSDQWITRAGRILRKTSLDELPQIFQIFTGKMSVVGPRPALWNQYDLIALRQENGADRIRPGLTGWAQVNGRDRCTLEEKARLDGEYAANVSFRMDLACIRKTLVNMLTGDDGLADAPGEDGADKEK